MSIVLSQFNAIELLINPSCEKSASLELARITAQGYSIKRLLTATEDLEWSADEVAANLVGVFVLTPDAPPTDTAVRTFLLDEDDYDEICEMEANGWNIHLDVETKIGDKVTLVTYVFTRSLEG